MHVQKDRKLEFIIEEKGEINKGEDIVILPAYCKKFSNFTIQLTAKYNGKIRNLNYGDIENNMFKVYGEDGEYSWVVHATREEIQSEFIKEDIVVKGDGPYKWFETIKK